MSLRDELEKLVRQEQDELEGKDKFIADFAQNKVVRFQTLKGLFLELQNSIEAKYQKMTFYDDRAIIEIGITTEGKLVPNHQWIIQPNDNGDFLEKVHELPGFVVHEKHLALRHH